MANDELTKAVKDVGNLPGKITGVNPLKAVGEAVQGAYENYGKPALRSLGVIKDERPAVNQFGYNRDGTPPAKIVGEPIQTEKMKGNI